MQSLQSTNRYALAYLPSRHHGRAPDHPWLASAHRFLAPLLVLRRLLPALVGFAGAEQAQVGAEVRAAGAGAFARRGGIQAEDTPQQLVRVGNVNHLPRRRYPQQWLSAMEDIS